MPEWRRKRPTWARLGEVLADFDSRFPKAARLASDPVHLAHAYAEERDVELAALVASSLAFGRASSLIVKARAVLEPLGPRPSERVMELRDREVPRHLDGWTHRWVKGADVARLLQGAGRLLREHGTLGAAFRAGLRADDPPDHLLPAMRRFARALGGGGAMTLGSRTVLSLPDGHAASKKWCLFLRWMVRPADGVDLGLWGDVGTARLTIPLDTHVARIGAYVGLTDRRSPGWAMAREITSNLARYAPEDPTRYDFALSHLGIMGGCPRRRDARRCAACDLVRACRL